MALWVLINKIVYATTAAQINNSWKNNRPGNNSKSEEQNCEIIDKLLQQAKSGEKCLTLEF